MAYFHFRCGDRITLLNDNCTASRNDSEFDHGIVVSAEPLVNDILFEIKIDRKVNLWSGSLEIGVIDIDPLQFDFPPCASKIHKGSWVMSATSIFKNGECILEGYGSDLDKLNQDDRIGLLRTSDGDLIIYINGESQGVAAEGLPNSVYAIVDLYGKCVQVTITSPILKEHNNDECFSGSSVLAIDNDVLNVTLGGDISELSMSSSNSLDIRMDMNLSVSLSEDSTRPDRLRFYDRCGSLVKLSNDNRSAERKRPLDEFNNGVVMTHRPIKENELFEIRIDRLVDKWSGSIEMGITTHNPNSLVFPATMTNMRSGTIMMSGCGILTNGKGTRREYGNFNLDELNEGDRVGMMRKSNGNLHYFINGLDQGIAAQRVSNVVWGVIDLYGMTIKVTIVERDEREEQNLVTRKNTRDKKDLGLDVQLPDFYDRLTFHSNCGTHAEVINNGRTAHRPNAVDDFNNGVVLTARQLKTGELFEIRLDRVVTKWAGSIEIGVTTHSPIDLEFPFTMTNVRSGTWMMTGSGIMHNGTIILEQYGVNLDRLQIGDRVGVVRKESGLLHFFVNGEDQGIAATNIPEKIFGVIDLYGQAVEASIVDMYDYKSPDTEHSSACVLLSDLRFHHVHGKNARIVNNGVTALRPRPLAEFNDSIVFSNRPLQDGELFEICLDVIVERWSGSIELGVTTIRPDEIDLPSTATDLLRDTWMLSGSSIIVNGKPIKINYLLDLDTLSTNVKLGVMRKNDKSLEFYRDGIPQGTACTIPYNNIYAVVDLYGRCAQVSISCPSQLPFYGSPEIKTYLQSDTSLPTPSTRTFEEKTNLHMFSKVHGKGILLTEDNRLALLYEDYNSSIVFSSSTLLPGEIFEVSIESMHKHLTGTLSIGVAISPLLTCSNELPSGCCYISGNELRYKDKFLQYFTPSLAWLNNKDRIGIMQISDGSIKIYINGEELSVNFPNFLQNIYAVFELKGKHSKIIVTSRKAQNNNNLQNNLELGRDIKRECELKNKHIGSTTNKCFYEFHENHGRNIELTDKYSARRVASYNQGVVVVKPALKINRKVEVRIEQIDKKWNSSLSVGVVCGPPERQCWPSNALTIKSNCCIIANDWISINGNKFPSNNGQNLINLSVSDTVGISLTNGNSVKLTINGIEEEAIPWTFPEYQPVHAIFDLFGACQQVKLVNPVNQIHGQLLSSANCEKADFESGEKGIISNDFTTTTSATTNTLFYNSLSNSTSKMSSIYKQ